MKKLIIVLIILNIAYAGWYVFWQSDRPDAEDISDEESSAETIILLSEQPGAPVD